jgi:hypothetical protein
MAENDLHARRFCGEFFPRQLNEDFIDETGSYHRMVGKAGILSEEQYFHPSGRRMGRQHQTKKKSVVTTDIELEQACLKAEL